MRQRIQDGGAQLLRLTRRLRSRLPLQGLCALQRDGAQGRERRRGELAHTGAIQGQTADGPDAQAKHAIPASGLGIEGIRAQKIGASRLRLGPWQVLTATIDFARLGIEQLHAVQVENLADQSRDEPARLTGTIQQ